MGGRSKQFNPRSIQAGSRRQKSSDFWHHVLPWLYGAILIAVLALGAVVYWPVLQKHQRLQNENAELTEKIEEQQLLTLKNREELYSLQDDPLYIERMARDVLNYGRKGETIYKFPSYDDRSPVREREPVKTSQ
ncbi:MAG: septum formation initiator family protein [Verrucomicrobiota bacterium]